MLWFMKLLPGKNEKWRLRGPKNKNFLGSMPPHPHRDWRFLRSFHYALLCVPKRKNHATPLHRLQWSSHMLFQRVQWIVNFRNGPQNKSTKQEVINSRILLVFNELGKFDRYFKITFFVELFLHFSNKTFCFCFCVNLFKNRFRRQEKIGVYLFQNSP